MYASLPDTETRIHTAYFVDLVRDDHGARFLRDLHAWAAGGRFRLLVVANEAANALEGAARAAVEEALVAAPLAEALDRIAVHGPVRFAPDVEALAARLRVPVRLFTNDWHGAQAWLRAPDSHV